MSFHSKLPPIPRSPSPNPGDPIMTVQLDPGHVAAPPSGAPDPTSPPAHVAVTDNGLPPAITTAWGAAAGTSTLGRATTAGRSTVTTSRAPSAAHTGSRPVTTPRVSGGETYASLPRPFPVGPSKAVCTVVFNKPEPPTNAPAAPPPAHPVVEWVRQLRAPPPANYIRTTKYTVWSFLPLNLFGQFRRVSNLYFLLAAIFSLVGSSTISPLSEIAPLVFVLTVTAIKDALEDYSRYKADLVANHQPISVVKNGSVTDIMTMDLTPGDIVFLKKGDKVPADLVLLSTSYEDGNCFIETSELDGETSLKRRNGLPATMHASTPAQVTQLAGRIQCELPNENLHKFEGVLYVQGADTAVPDGAHSLSSSQLLLRGSFLRNTDYCYGVVVYAGVETKIFKNLKQGGLKFSTMEDKVNTVVSLAFAYNALMLVVSMILGQQRIADVQKASWYLQAAGYVDLDGTASGLLEMFMNAFILYSYTIPVSLFVIIEAVRVIQRQFMVWDDELKSVNGRPMRVNNSNLNEDLSVVEYVFSDKTGTLTRNEMVLVKVCLGDMVTSVAELLGIKQPTDAMRQLWRCILLCNSAIPSTENGEVTYESQSPDEIALLNGIRAHVQLVQRTKNTVRFTELGVPVEVTILAVLEFNSDRKRMTVVVRDETGTVVAYCKGADNIMVPRLRCPATDPALVATTRHLHDFSEQGLRTLVFAAKPLANDAYARFQAQLDDAARALDDRDARVARVADHYERGFDLLGASAIEDRLQDQVPETIEALLASGIRVWLLTGDKTETAVNIGHSCRLVPRDMTILRIDAPTLPDLAEQMARCWDVVAAAAEGGDQLRCALVVTGDALAMALETCPRELLAIATACMSVICARVSPIQKALVVRLVKTELGVTTLSIGDGANDVSMIQEAHIGVGIEGVEGAQAVRAADFAIVEFRALLRLLSVHGRYSLQRLSYLVVYSFYKNISFITIQFLFGFWNIWSGSTNYSAWMMPYWNVLYTFLPPFLYGFLDKDVPESQLRRYPAAYMSARDASPWVWYRLVAWTVSSIWHTIVQWFGMYWLFDGTGALTVSGFTGDVYQYQWLNGITMLLIVTAKIALQSHYWTWITVAGLVISLILYVLTLGVVEGITLSQLSTGGAIDNIPIGTNSAMYATPAYWFVAAVIPVAALLPDLAVAYWQAQFRPDDATVLREEHAQLMARTYPDLAAVEPGMTKKPSLAAVAPAPITIASEGEALKTTALAPLLAPGATAASPPPRLGARAGD
ncbi:phospholipid-translocating P-type ATPase, flippase [Allomyces macrogynus ATCC 38327]|uniref:Phospholipid-transporting ATPase n=2 Tax=Allomyces macrogynus (strain ATCC 38327) TaxID=578462 RepID=A0A0L0SNB3_ALLM3|nr:phospholipid-translocating P-type ATPase, flippase [Allomyces macrogynus ATCC 38327]|eukprot:KNE63874.1 phospholipid-translocating P-type ATPase, flippase [Allomyces macrogynus ATCC 38327]